jgi:hypothetical protein
MPEEETAGWLPLYAERAHDIDFDRMHRTWALGFLLGLEATAYSTYSHSRLQALKDLAPKYQLPSGSFYPARVPWVTARVLIGLSQAGESIETSELVRTGCNWLLTDAPEGPCEFGAWPPHTGIWNSTLGTTAMCLNALVRCGVSADHPTVDLASNYLMDGRSEWSRDGQEIDCAFALETFLLMGSPWRDFSSELASLISWTQNPKIWENVVLDASQAKDESLKIPLITVSLVGIIWSIVKSELPLLLEDLASGTFLPESMSLSEYKSELQTIVRQLEEIRAHIRRNIEQRLATISREELTKAAPVQAKLNEYRGFAGRCDAAVEAAKRLTAQATGPSFKDGVDKLRNGVNQLGQDIFGQRWKWMA